MVASFSAHVHGNEDITANVVSGTDSVYLLVDDGGGASFSVHFPDADAARSFLAIALHELNRAMYLR